MKRLLSIMAILALTATTMMASRLSDIAHEVEQIKGVKTMNGTAQLYPEAPDVQECLVIMLSEGEFKQAQAILQNVPDELLATEISEGKDRAKIWMEPVAGTNDAEMLMVLYASKEYVVVYMKGDMVKMTESLDINMN